MEGTNANLTAWVAKDEARFGELTGHLWLVEEETAWARSELGSERNYRLKVEKLFAVTLEQTVEKKVVEALALTWV